MSVKSKASARAHDIRALCASAHVEALGDDMIASDMTLAEARRFVCDVTALLDRATSGVMPAIDALTCSSAPEHVIWKARVLIALAVGDSRPQSNVQH